MGQHERALILRVIAAEAGPLLVPTWVKSFDVDARGGRGAVVYTLDPGDALTFPDELSVYAAWRSRSTVQPERPDGLPNCPLSALTLLVDARIDGITYDTFGPPDK